MISRYFSLFALCGTFFVCGCGGGAGTSPADKTPTPSPEVTSQDQFKERLQFISENGGMGSALAGIVEMAEKSGDAALVSEAKQLEKVQSPEKAKSIAKSMLGKLK